MLHCVLNNAKLLYMDVAFMVCIVGIFVGISEDLRHVFFPFFLAGPWAGPLSDCFWASV